MEQVDMFGRVTPCWSAKAGSSWAADAARCAACGRHWLTPWVCFALSENPDPKEAQSRICLITRSNYKWSESTNLWLLSTVRAKRLFSSVTNRSPISISSLSVAASSVSSFSTSSFSSSNENSCSSMASISLSTLSASPSSWSCLSFSSSSWKLNCSNRWQAIAETV